jgi:peptide/nickel transport system permease protein
MADATVIPDALDEVAPPKSRHGAAAWASWLARRIGLAILTLWLVSILVFIATTSLGDPVRAILGREYNSDPGRVKALTEQLNLDQSVISRYFDWLGGLLTGDLGTSIAAQRPVSELIGSNVVNTLVLVLLSAVVMIPVAFGIAMVSANYRRRRPDTIIQTVMLALAGLPEFVIGILLVALFSTTVFHILPAVTIIGPGGNPWDEPKGMILPVATLVLAVAPYVSRIVRATLL